MVKQRRGMARREFLQSAGLTAGAVALAGFAPTALWAGEKMGAQLIGKQAGTSIVHN